MPVALRRDDGLSEMASPSLCLEVNGRRSLRALTLFLLHEPTAPS